MKGAFLTQWIQLQNMCVKVRLSACLFAHLDTVIRVYVQAASVLKQLQAFNEILKVTKRN